MLVRFAAFISKSDIMQVKYDGLQVPFGGQNSSIVLSTQDEVLNKLACC